MSDQRSERPTVLKPTDERVLLLVAGERDRSLLTDRLDQRYEVVDGDPDDVAGFDLCIVDARTYRQVAEELSTLKRAVDTYLPVLVLVEDRERVREAEWLAEEVGGTVDDVLVIPTPKHELDARVEALLRARRQSRRLALFRRAMDEATIGISITNPNHPENPLVYVNDGFCRLTGYDREAVLGRNCRFLQGPDTEEATVDRIRAAIEAEEPVTVELLNYRADGEPFWNLLTIAPVRDDSGGVTHYLGFQRDITERIHWEQEVRRERERFEALARTATDAILVVDADGVVRYANPAVERVFGYDPEAVEGRSLTKLMPEEYQNGDREGFKQYLKPGERKADRELIQFSGRHADGHEVPLEVSPAEFEGPDGPLFAGIVRDVTEREELQAELRAERELLEGVFETSPIGIVVVDGDGDVIRVNEAAEAELGLERSEIVSRTYDDPDWVAVDVDGEPIPDADLPAGRVLRTGDPVEGYRHGIRTDGETRWISVNAAPMTDEDGVVEAVVISVENITDRLERERELEQYETIVETSTDPIYVLDPENRFVRVNNAMVEATGRDREELLGSHAATVLDDATVERSERFIRELLDGDRRRATFEGAMTTADGTSREFATSLSLLREDGEFRGTVVIAHDVTDLRDHQRRLSVLDRVLRHNLRNQMNVVLGYATELTTHDDPEVATLGAAIEDNATDLMELSESAREFGSVISGTAARPAPVDVADLVETAVADARRQHPDADVAADLPETAPALANEPFALAVDELLENAVVHNDSDPPTVEVSVTVDDDAVTVRVADDGPGIDDIAQRALLSGSESPLEHAQGLGLWLVRWTVDAVGGEFDVADGDPRGTVVTVRLPRPPG